MSKAPACPECGSRRVWKDGLRRLADGSIVQRWLCRDCGYRFSESRMEKPRKIALYKTTNCRVGGWDGQPKNSAKAVKALKELEETEKRAAGATKIGKDVKGAIINFIWKLKREGYAEDTIRDYGYIIKTLARRGADIFDPESVKEVIAKQKTWSESRKWQVVKAYSKFAEFNGISWIPPRYKPAKKLPFIPTEEELDQLIAGCNPQMATFLQLLKETGMRCGEAYNLKWTDIDFRSNTVRITPEKSSNPRIFKISNTLISMLSRRPRNSERVFSYKSKRSLHKSFEKQRKRIAYKLGNPRILKITFHTFRHWKATMEYHKTKDILHVMRLLGHKNIQNTLIYTQLVSFNDSEYICKVAKTLEEATQLIEAGFEYVTDMNGYKLFRKRK